MRTSARAVLLLLVSGAMAAACGAAMPIAEVEEPIATVPADQAQAIRGVVEQYRQAYEVGAVDAIKSLYSQDLDVVVVYQGRSHQGWTAVHEFLSKRLGAANQVRMSIKDIAIRELGPGAVVLTATRTSTIGDGSVSVTESGQLSLALQNRDGSWVVVAEHFSYPVGRS